MNLATVHVMQHDLRNLPQIPEMVEFVQDDGFFTENALAEYGGDLTLIELNEFEDGAIYVHNGHHRVAAVWLAGRKLLGPGEYTLSHRTYADYLESHFLWPDGSWMGYVTPFDPRTHIRRPDLMEFKSLVRRIFDELGEAETRSYIYLAQDLYKSPKHFHMVPELADYITGG